MMLPQLSQFNNWPCRSESVPQNRYMHQSNMAQEMGHLEFGFILRVWTLTLYFCVEGIYNNALIIVKGNEKRGKQQA